MRISHRIVNIAGSDTSVAFIDVQGINLERADDFDPDNLIWTINTYKSFLAGTKPSALEYLLQPINNFLATLKEEEARKLSNFFVDARILIADELDDRAFKTVVKQLGGMFYDVCMDTNIVDKLIEYVVTANLSIPDLRDIGHRPQDSAEYTFYYADYVDLTAISLMCKLLGPIWGDLIYNTSSYIDNADKEVYCSEVISPILGHPKFAKINHRFINYISNITGKQVQRYAEDIDFICAHCGFTKERFRFSIYAILLVKRFVNVDLMRADCNIMKYVATSAEKQMINQLKTMANKANLRKREDVSKKTDGWESSTSSLEHESRVSRGTADIPVIVKFGINRSINKIIEKFGIVPEYYESSLAYYNRNIVPPSLFNRCCVSTLLGYEIGGAFGLQYLDVTTYTKLIVITQLYIAQNYKSSQLTHLMTCMTATTIKDRQVSSTDSRIMMNARASQEYKSITQKLPYIVNSKDINTQLEAVQKWIIEYDHFHNTAPTIIALLDEDGDTRPGSLVEYDERVIHELYALLTGALSRYEDVA